MNGREFSPVGIHFTDAEGVSGIVNSPEYCRGGKESCQFYFVAFFQKSY